MSKLVMNLFHGSNLLIWASLVYSQLAMPNSVAPPQKYRAVWLTRKLRQPQEMTVLFLHIRLPQLWRRFWAPSVCHRFSVADCGWVPNSPSIWNLTRLILMFQEPFILLSPSNHKTKPSIWTRFVVLILWILCSLVQSIHLQSLQWWSCFVLNCRSGFIILGNDLHTCIHKSPHYENCSGLFHPCIGCCSFCCR